MKSYFNVPNNIDSRNRHLGIDKNVRKNKYEPKAKKKHRVARLRFLNDKRNLEIFRMSIDAMYDHIELLNQHYYNLKLAEEERIYNIELEKQRIIEQAEIQKQMDIINFNNTVSMMQEQLDLIPIYKQHIENIILENQMIEEEQKLIEEMRLQEENNKLISQFNLYFDEIKRKKESNIQLLENLKKQKDNESILHNYINNYKKTQQRYNDIYEKALYINNKIIDEQLNKQQLLDQWSNNIINYNNYVSKQSDIISNYKEEYELQLHKEKINAFKNKFYELNNKVLEITNSINNNKHNLDKLDIESDTNVPSIDEVKINTTYINHFNSALKDMKNLQQYRINQINQLKQIEQQQKDMLLKEEKEKELAFNNTIKSYRQYIEEERKHNQNVLLKQKGHFKKLEEQKKERERRHIESKSIKLQKDIITFNNSIELYRKNRDHHLKMIEQKRENEKKEKLIKIKKSENIKYFNTIEKSIQNVYVKKIEEINKKYEIYQQELITIEKQKQKEQQESKKKLEKLIDTRNKIKQNYMNLEDEYNNILKTQREQLEHDNLIKKQKEDKYNNLISNYNDVINKIKLNKMLKIEEELKRKEEEIRKQELEEYEKELSFTNSIKHYTNLLIENKKTHDEFKISLKKFKEIELKKLEQIKKEESDKHNKDIVNFSIEYILDSVDIEIENIEYKKLVDSYNEQIHEYYNSVESRKLELEQIKQKQLQDAEYEKLKLEEYEKQVNEYKKQQEEKFLEQMKEMLLQFNVNTNKHIELIEKQRHDYELAEKKKIEEQEENERLIKEKSELAFQKSISYYSSELKDYDQNIIEYKKNIIQAKKEIEDKKRQHDLYLKKLEEQKKKLESEREQQILTNFKNSLSEYKNNLYNLELEKEKKRIAVEDERKRIQLDSISKKKAIQQKYIDFYTNSLLETKKAHNEYIENQKKLKLNMKMNKREY